MASFTILVTHSPFDQQASHSALKFCRAAVSSGHNVLGVFFYQAGVANGNRFQSGHSDEINLYDNWCELNQQHGIPLQVCVTAANRRGVINPQDAEDKDISHYNLTMPFESVGLGDLVSLMQQTDRTIQF